MVTLYTRILRQLHDNPTIAQESLARAMDVTMRTIQRHIEVLEQEGYVLIDRQHKPYSYAVNAPAVRRGLYDAQYLLER